MAVIIIVNVIGLLHIQHHYNKLCILSMTKPERTNEWTKDNRTLAFILWYLAGWQSLAFGWQPASWGWYNYMLSLEHTHACECVHNIRTYICCLFDSVSFRYTTKTRQCSISFSPSLSHAALSLFLFLRILKKTRKNAVAVFHSAWRCVCYFTITSAFVFCLTFFITS